MKTKMFELEKKNKSLRNNSCLQRQHIIRLTRRIMSLKNTIKELRGTEAISDSGLQCSNSIAETDVSEF